MGEGLNPSRHYVRSKGVCCLFFVGAVWWTCMNVLWRLLTSNKVHFTLYFTMYFIFVRPWCFPNKETSLQYTSQFAPVCSPYTSQFAFFLGNQCNSVPGDSVPEQPRDCWDALRKNPGSQSGVYTLYPLGQAQSTFCEMETDGGGWTVKTRDWGGWVYHLWTREHMVVDLRHPILLICFNCFTTGYT